MKNLLGSFDWNVLALWINLEKNAIFKIVYLSYP